MLAPDKRRSSTLFRKFRSPTPLYAESGVGDGPRAVPPVYFAVRTHTRFPVIMQCGIIRAILQTNTPA